MFNAENRQAWQDLANHCDIRRPSQGRTVIVTKGKNKGETGVVFWHDWNRYGHVNQYRTSAQITLGEFIGREGFRCGIKTFDGKTIWVNAEYCELYYTAI